MPAKPWQIAESAEEKMRLCLRAADMKARGAPFARIADELGLDSPKDAARCAEKGYSLSPCEDHRTARRNSARRLDMAFEGLFAVIDDPPPMTTVTGKLVLDPETGERLPDKAVVVATWRTIVQTDKEYRQLFGADAPKRSVNFHALGGPEEVEAILEVRKAELAEIRRQRELEDARFDDSPATVPIAEIESSRYEEMPRR